jgi:hypothetical protein
MDGSSWAKAVPSQLALLLDAFTFLAFKKAHLGIHAFSAFFDSLCNQRNSVAVSFLTLKSLLFLRKPAD